MIIAVVFAAVAFMAPIGVQNTFALENDNKTTDTDTVSVIFTHDMHSHMDADKIEKNGKIVEAGGFARLKTAMKNVKEEYPESFVLDAGDFSMGTPYQTIFSKEASELKMMKLIGVEATTFGNHEFDYRAAGLTSMLKAGKGQGPQLVVSNIDWEATFADETLKKDAVKLKEACDAYGAKEYITIEHDGVKAAVFGLLGERAVDYAPESGLLFKDAVQAAKETVDKIKSEENPDIIICLSHCGTLEDEKDKLEETEDYVLAEQVPDIDLIVSGHTHTTLDEVVQVGNTFIGSCGSYNTGMGHIVLNRTADGYELGKYEVLPLDESVKPDEDVNLQLKKYKGFVDSEYFNQYGYSADQIIASNNINFASIEDFGVVQGEDPLGNLIADSYKYAVAQAEDGTITGYVNGGVASGEVVSKSGGAQIAVVPSGVVRGSFFPGNIKVTDTFNASSLGYGKDGLPGYPLVRAYLTGKELKAVAEVDASVSNFMGVARLYNSGLEYSWNPSRLILNRAVDVKFNNGPEVKSLNDDELYSVVADLYSCQMLGTVKDQSFGLLAIEPKDKEGNPITDFEDHIIYDNGKELKAWYALTSYIDSFEDDKIPDYYNQLQGRKTEIKSKNPVELFKQPNNIFWIVTAVVAVLILVVVGVVILVRKLRRRRTD